MIKLAFCITELNIGGAERALCELAVRLDKGKFSVAVYSLQAKPCQEQSACVEMLEASGIPVHFLDIKSPWSLLTGFFELRKKLRRQRPDIFVSFLFHANFLGRLAARSLGIRHIISGIRVAERARRSYILLDKWSSHFVKTYICVSDSVAEFTRTVGKIPAEKIVVIPNGVSSAGTPASMFRQNRIIAIGRLTHQKGLDWFFATFPEWLDKLPGWGVWIVGEGEERETLTKMLAQPEFDGIRDQVNMMGWRADAAELLAASRLLVLPSRWEGMPNVVLQAMAAGLPVVATNVEGVAELLGSNERLVEFGDTAALAEQILLIAQNEELAEELGQANFDRAARHFRMESVVEKYEKLFENLLAGKIS